MRFRKTFIAIVVFCVAGCFSFLPTVVSATEQTSTSVVSAIGGEIDWGVNHDGWNVAVYNDSGFDLTYYRSASVKVYAAQTFIANGTTSRDIRGRDWMGSPTNMRVIYRPADPSSDGLYRFFIIQSDTSGTGVKVRCGEAEIFAGVYLKNVIENYKCKVLNNERNHPIGILFTG